MIDANIVSLVSVVSAAIVSVYSTWISKIEREKSQTLQQEFELEISRIKNEAETLKESRTKQHEIFSKMLPFLIEAGDHNFSNQKQLLVLAFELKATTDVGDYVAESSASLIRALTDGKDKLDTYSWNIIADNLASGINARYRSYAEYAAAKHAQVIVQNKKLKLTARIALSIRTGWRAFRESRPSK